MAIERHSYIERVTIVLARDGTLKGAQQETIEELVEDGIVLSTRYAPAAPLDAGALAGVLPDVAAALAELAAAQVMIEALTQEMAEKRAAIDAALETVSELRGVIEQRQVLGAQ